MEGRRGKFSVGRRRRRKPPVKEGGGRLHASSLSALFSTASILSTRNIFGGVCLTAASLHTPSSCLSLHTCLFLCLTYNKKLSLFGVMDVEGREGRLLPQHDITCCLQTTRLPSSTQNKMIMMGCLPG